MSCRATLTLVRYDRNDDFHSVVARLSYSRGDHFFVILNLFQDLIFFMRLLRSYTA